MDPEEFPKVWSHILTYLKQAKPLTNKLKGAPWSKLHQHDLANVMQVSSPEKSCTRRLRSTKLELFFHGVETGSTDKRKSKSQLCATITEIHFVTGFDYFSERVHLNVLQNGDWYDIDFGMSSMSDRMECGIANEIETMSESLRTFLARHDPSIVFPFLDHITFGQVSDFIWQSLSVQRGAVDSLELLWTDLLRRSHTTSICRYDLGGPRSISKPKLLNPSLDLAIIHYPRYFIPSGIIMGIVNRMVIHPGVGWGSDTGIPSFNILSDIVECLEDALGDFGPMMRLSSRFRQVGAPTRLIIYGAFNPGDLYQITIDRGFELGTSEAQTRNQMMYNGGLVQRWDVKRQEMEEVKAMKRFVPEIMRQAPPFWKGKVVFKLWKDAPICEGCGMV